MRKVKHFFLIDETGWFTNDLNEAKALRPSKGFLTEGWKEANRWEVRYESIQLRDLGALGWETPWTDEFEELIPEDLWDNPYVDHFHLYEIVETGEKIIAVWWRTDRDDLDIVEIF